VLEGFSGRAAASTQLVCFTDTAAAPPNDDERGERRSDRSDLQCGDDRHR